MTAAQLTEEPLWRAAGPWTLRRRLPMAADTQFFRGGAVGQDGDGNVARMEDGVADLQPLGVAEWSYDNSGGAAGAKHLDILAGLFGFDNAGGGDAVAADTKPGTPLYAYDDHTAASNSGAGTRSFLGAFEKVDERGVVWVWVGIPFGLTSVTGVQPQVIEATITHADLDASATSQSIDVGDAVAVDSYVLGHSVGDGTFTAFSGGGAGSCGLKLGIASDDDAIVTSTDVFTGASGFPKAGTSGVLGYSGATLAAGSQIAAKFTADVNVALLTAGSVKVRVLLAPAS